MHCEDSDNLLCLIRLYIGLTIRLCRWKLNNSVGGAPGFLGAFGASCGSNGVRSVRQWCAVREQVQVRAQVRVQVRAGAASFVQCGGHGVRAVRL